MKTRLLTVAALGCLVASSFGQQSAMSVMDRFQFHAADLQLLEAKPVQAELKITTAQRNAMNAFAEKHRAKLMALDELYKKQKKTAEDAQKDPKIVAYFLELKTNVMLQLTKAQLKRLAEISLQRVSLSAITDDMVAQKIGMSKDQLTKFRNAFQDGGEQFAAAQRAAAAPILNKYKDKKPKDQKEAEALRKQFDAEMDAAMQKAAPQLNAIKAAAEKKLRAMITPAQWAKWTALLGKPFKPA